MIRYILNENVIKGALDKIESNAEIFYEHMLKWKYWKFEQCSSWTTSIFRSSYNIKNFINMGTNIYNKSNDELLKAYNNGLKAIYNIDGINIDIKKLDNGKLLEQFNNTDIISDKDAIKEWLIKFARDNKSIDYAITGYNIDFSKKR